MIVVLLRPQVRATNGARRISVGEWRGSRVLSDGKVEKRQPVVACCTSVELHKGTIFYSATGSRGQASEGTTNTS